MQTPQEWTLGDIVSVLTRRWRFILTVTLAVTIVALGRALVFEPPWLVSGALQLAQVGQLGQTGLPAAQLVEPAQRSLERLKLREFQNAVLARVGLPVSEPDREADLYRETFVAKVLNNTELVELRLHARSPALGKRLLSATADQLAAVHEEMARPTIQRLRAQLEVTDRDVETARRDLAEYKALNRSNVSSPSQFSERVHLAFLITGAESRLLDHELRKTAFAEQLNPLRTYGTSLLQAPYVKSRHIVVLHALLGFVAGLALGCFLAFVLQSDREGRADARGRA